MRPVLLIDFGSTYTKVTAADVDEGRLLGTANAYTTVQSDINNGLSDALSKLEKVTGKLDFCERYAASSAAGGLRMLASGLVPELTAEAAKCASLGAGAKVLKTYAFKLNEDDADEIKAINPDIFLLVGGTDGGNTDCILHNAHVLADIGGDFPVILAGNRRGERQDYKPRPCGSASAFLTGAKCIFAKMLCRNSARLTLSRPRKRFAKFSLKESCRQRDLPRRANLFPAL